MVQGIRESIDFSGDIKAMLDRVAKYEAAKRKNPLSLTKQDAETLKKIIKDLNDGRIPLSLVQDAESETEYSRTPMDTETLNRVREMNSPGPEPRKIHNPKRRKNVERQFKVASRIPVRDWDNNTLFERNPLLDEADKIDYRKITVKKIEEAARNLTSRMKIEDMAFLNHMVRISQDGAGGKHGFRKLLRDLMHEDYYDGGAEKLVNLMERRANATRKNNALREYVELKLNKPTKVDEVTDYVRQKLKDYIAEFRHGPSGVNNLNFNNTIFPFLELDRKVGQVAAPLWMVESFGRTPEQKEAAEKALQPIMRDYSQIYLQTEYHDLVRRFWESPEGKELSLFQYDYEWARVDERLAAKEIDEVEATREKEELKLMQEKKYVAEILERTFRTNGSILTGEAEDRLLDEMAELQKLETSFQKNLHKSKFEMVFKPKAVESGDLTLDDLDGFPEELKYLAKRKADQLRREVEMRYLKNVYNDEKIKKSQCQKQYIDQAIRHANKLIPPNSLVINLDDGLYEPFMKFVKNSALRKRLYIASYQRGTKFATGGLAGKEKAGELDNKDTAWKIAVKRMQIAQMTPRNRDYGNEDDPEPRTLEQHFEYLLEKIIQDKYPKFIDSIQLEHDRDEKYEDYIASAVVPEYFEHQETTERYINRINKMVQMSACQTHTELVNFQKQLRKKGLMDHDKKLSPDETLFEPWNREYLVTAYLKDKLGFDENATREYFELENTIQGAFDIAKKLFNVDITPIDNTDNKQGLWDASVRPYQVSRDGVNLGTLNMDLFMRKNKPAGQWWSFAQVDKAVNIDGTSSLPNSILTTSIEKPLGKKPLLLSPLDVKYFFHELGHSLHTLLTKAKLSYNSGYNCSFEFAELPSTLMENFAYHPQAVKQYAKHYQTGEAMPDDMLEKLAQSQHLLKPYSARGHTDYETYMTDVFFDLEMHHMKSASDQYYSQDIDTFYDWMAHNNKFVQWQGKGEDRISRPSSNSYVFCGGYETQLSTYIVSEAAATALWDKHFAKEDGSLDIEGGGKVFRENFMELGGTQDASEMAPNLIGYLWDLDALAKRFSQVSLNPNKNARLEKRLLKLAGKPLYKHEELEAKKAEEEKAAKTKKQKASV